MRNSVLNQLEAINQQWESIKNIPDDLTPLGYPQLTKADLDGALGELKSMAQLLSEDNEYEPHAISLAAADAAIGNLSQYVITHIPSNPSGNLKGLITVLDTVRTMLARWVEESDPRHKRAITAAIQKLAETNARMSDASGIYDTLKTTADDVNKESIKAGEIVSTLDSMLAGATEELTELMGNVKAQITENKSALEESLADAQENKKKVHTLLDIALDDSESIAAIALELKELKQTVDAALVKQTKLFEEFEGFRKQAEDILGDTNRASMAGAFIERRTTYKIPLRIWGGVFGASLVVLGFIAFWVVKPLIGIDASFGSEGFEGSVSTQADWVTSFIRLPLSIPAIWLAWFSVRQYGYNTRLMEDYAYKAASAQAFEGYKREAKEAGDAMQNKLLETAISHLSDNPIRVYESGNNHGSPAHELFEKVFKDDKLFQQLLEVIDRLKPKA